jgi:putative spermidine/putrescine transport system substrate-binding protein
MIARRTLLAGVGAAALARPALAAGPGIVATWGGDYAELLTQTVEKPLLVPQGIEVLQDLGSQDTRKTKLIAEKAQRRGSLDVIHLSDTDMFQMNLQGFFDPVAYDKLKNGGNIIPALRKSYSVPHIVSGQVVVYNPDKVDVPKGFADLLNPKYKGRIAIPDLNYPAVVFGAAILGGGSMSNWEPAKKVLMDLKKLEPKVYPSHETLVGGLKSGEVWIGPNWLAREFMWEKAGVKLGHAVPEEGAIPVTFEAAVAKNAQHKDAAWAYLDAMLDAKAQLGFADRMGYAPTVTNAQLPANLLGAISFTPAQQKALRTPDYAYQAAQLPAILDFWNRSFKG